MKKSANINNSWLTGVYADGDEINVGLSYVSISETEKREAYFFDGDAGNDVIEAIYQIWMMGDCTQQEALNRWKFLML